MIKNQTISLIMPCKNEARALQSVLENLPPVIDEVVVVDNNSSDETKNTAKKYGARVFTELRKDKNNIGYGYAIQKGIKEAKGNIIVCMDGDGSYPVKEIPALINKLINNNLDFISCNRLPFKDPKKMSFVRSLGVKILNSLTLVLFGYKIKDSLTGMWVFKRYAIDNLSLSQGGWNLSLEIKLKAILHTKTKFAEQQISYHDRIFDISKQNLFKTGLEHCLYLFKFRLDLALANIFNFESNFTS